MTALGKTRDKNRVRDTRPIYARVLRLKHIRPGSMTCFVFFEGSVLVGVLLAFAELVPWWVALVLPVTVAVMVKLNDLIAGAVAGPAEPRSTDDEETGEPSDGEPSEDPSSEDEPSVDLAEGDGGAEPVLHAAPAPMARVAESDEAATDQTATDQTATDQTATDETATDETATDETATDETATDETGTDEDESDTGDTEPAAADREPRRDAGDL